MKKIKVLLGLLIIFTCFIIGNISVKAETVTPTISLRSDTVEPGGRIYVDMEGVDDYAKSKKIWGFFSSETDPYEQGGMFGLELEDVYTDNPYFETSSYMIMGHKYIFHSISLGDATYTSNSNGGNTGFNTNGKNEVTVVFPVNIDRFEVAASSKEVTKNDKVKFIVNLSKGDDYDKENIGIMIRNVNEPNVTAYGYINRINENEYYFDLSKAQGNNRLTTGEYIVSTINFFPKKGGTAIQFVADDYGGQERNILIADSFKIIESKKENATNKQKDTKKTEEFLKKVSINKQNAKINEKVGVEISTKKNLTSATLIFSNDKESMTVNVKSLNSKDSYFIIPFTTNSGTYTLDFAILKDIDGKEYQYRKGDNYYNIVHFDFNSVIEVDSAFKDGDSLSLDNSKITGEIIEKIKKLESNIVLDINANENPIISKELFETIKGSNKTIVIKYNDIEWTFNGLDVKTSKQIDVSTNLYKTNEDEDIKTKYNKGMVLDFAKNDKLPGKCLIKLYNTEELKKVLNNNNINIYYYNEDTDKFEIVKTDIEYNKKGFYEFYIDHNSKYLLTNGEINKEYLNNPEKAIKTNNSLDLKTILIIGIPSLIIIIILIIVIVLSKKKKQRNNINVNEVSNNNNNI